jgi:hypothetical protein
MWSRREGFRGEQRVGLALGWLADVLVQRVHNAAMHALSS